MSKEDKGIVLTTELVGIRNLKTTGNYRLEFDVFEIDTHKVKELKEWIKLKTSIDIKPWASDSVRQVFDKLNLKYKKNILVNRPKNTITKNI